MNPAEISLQIKQLLIDILSLDYEAEAVADDMLLLGDLPEFDSMAIVSVIAAIEEMFEIEIEDDEISEEVFESVASLVDFIIQKQ